MKLKVAGNVLQLVTVSVCLSAQCLQRPHAAAAWHGRYVMLLHYLVFISHQLYKPRMALKSLFVLMCR